jgi:hypothetical protein
MIRKLKSIFKAMARGLGFFMTPVEERRKEKFFKDMQDKAEPIPCPMHEDYDEVDYKAADHLDEVAEIERMRRDK